MIHPRILLLAVIAATASGQGWVGQHRISLPDSTADEVPSIAFDGTGAPWVAWHGGRRDSSPTYSRWLGDHFDTELPVAPNDSGARNRLSATLTFDQVSGMMWMNWANWWNNDSYTIGASRWQGNGWETPTCVNPDDSFRYSSSSSIASGGGAVWSAWDRARTVSSDTSIVFASRWSEAQHRWAPRMQVSQPDGGFYWWCNIAVDGQGRPHVFWCDPVHLRLWYSFYDGMHWSAPVPVNDTDRTSASPYANPQISFDQDGIMHVIYTGALIGAVYRDIMYTWNDGTGWKPSVRASSSSRDTLLPPWYGSVAATRRNDIWAVWDRQGESTDQFRVYASHFDGSSWSKEVRLDDDSAYYDGSPKVALDAQGEPWVVWNGIDYGTHHFTIYYNRYGIAGVNERARDNGVAGKHLCVSVSNPCTQTARVLYTLEAPSPVELRIFDGTGRCLKTLAKPSEPAGQHVLEWDCRAAGGQMASPGVYFCRLKAGSAEATTKFILVGR